MYTYVSSPVESLHIVMLCTDVQLCSEDSAQHDCETTADLQVVGVSVLLV